MAQGSGGVDLSGLSDLENFGSMSFGALIEGSPNKADQTVVSDGKPLILKMVDIEEDPDQPRIEFEAEKMQEMRDTIRVNLDAGRQPIKKPISVKRHPTKDGKWLLNDGARRFRACGMEGLTEIPAFIDEEHDDYDQLIVNLHNAGHTPLEIALFIQKREALGDKKALIAKKLGKNKVFVTKHSKLLDMPPSVRKAYDDERCRELEALYLLVLNYEVHPEQIDDLCLNSSELISRGVVTEFLKQLNAKQPAHFPETNSGGGQTASSGLSPLDSEGHSNNEEEPVSNPSFEPETTTENQEITTVPDDEKLDSEKPVKPQDPDKIKKAIVQISHDARPGRLLIDRRAATGLAWIKYDDDGQELEIDIGTAKLIAIVEGA